ncbi:MAG TPA: NmrA/HSCARG family protein [bacterium]
MADHKNEPILVTGATGQQGGAVVRALLKEKYPVVALTRHPDKAADLRKQGATVVLGDLTNRDSLDRALQGIRRAFLVTTPFEHGEAYETEQGVKFADACMVAGVQHLVFSSVASAQRNTGIPHFDSKWKVEEHLRRNGIPHTILRPVFFMENFGAPWLLGQVRGGRVSTPVRADRPLQMIAVEDIPKFVVAAFEHPDIYLGKEIDIAGDELRFSEAVQMISKEADRTVLYEPMPESEAEKAYGHDFAVMFRWFNDVGYNVDIDRLEKLYNIKLMRFKDWIKKAPFIRELKEETAYH